MLNTMLSLIPFNPSGEGIQLAIYYGICLVAIIAALIVIGAFKRKTKKELRAETVKKACVKAKKYAEEILASSEYKGAHMLLGATKLLNLSKAIAQAAWYAFQIVGEKKDIVVEGIANSLDALATEVGRESENGYVPADVYEADVKNAIAGLEANIEKLDKIIKK